jgi:peptidoglycan/LPS O-acetylase OafA/YrhL
MKQNNTLYRLSFLAGSLLILAAAARALSINNLLIAINTGDISRQFAGSILINGASSSLLLFLVGVWVLFLSSDLRKWQRRARAQGILISLSLILFSGGFWLRYPRSFHLGFFFLIGILLLFPLVIYDKGFKKQISAPKP